MAISDVCQFDPTEDRFYRLECNTPAKEGEILHAAAIHGWRTHVHVEYGEDGEVTRDDTYIAHPDWVERYHRNGGAWGYND